MRRTLTTAWLAAVCLSSPAARATPPDPRLSPYGSDTWDRLHQALFVREDADGPRVHGTDPFLFSNSTRLLRGEPHRTALGRLDDFLRVPPGGEARQRFLLQRDLWAAFDHAGWAPDDWVYKSADEPAAVALRGRLAKAVGRLALSDAEFEALPDNLAEAVAAKTYPADHDPARGERPFLPAGLFDEAGPWVRVNSSGRGPKTPKHFDGVGGRSMFTVFLRLPGGRAATERYLKDLKPDAVTQFPAGTMTAMVRRALAVDRAARPRVTPVTELVQVRVYRRIPEGDAPNRGCDSGEQDVAEFVLDRAAFSAGKPGLRAVGADEPFEPFERNGADPLDDGPGRRPTGKQLRSCVECHRAPGVRGMLSMEQGLRGPGADGFRPYTFAVEQRHAVLMKQERFDWGLLRGLLEAK